MYFRRNLGLHVTPDLHRTRDPHDGCPFNGHSRRMRDLHRRHAPCPWLKRRPQTGFPHPRPGILGHFLCFRRIAGFAWISVSATWGAIWIFLTTGLPTGTGWSPICCALGAAWAPRIFGSTGGGLISFSSLSSMHLFGISVSTLRGITDIFPNNLVIVG